MSSKIGAKKDKGPVQKPHEPCSRRDGVGDVNTKGFGIQMKYL